MTIQERRCPRCAIRRTINLAHWGTFCFNCRLQWGTQGAAEVAAVEAPLARYQFTPAELARLEAYRGAVRAGLYTDWPRLPAQARGRHQLTPHSWRARSRGDVPPA
jgi:hypothetical protein